ncbi:MAG: hypothetical protein ABEI13_02145 [Candidatus Paceibacteria bacterium]
MLIHIGYAKAASSWTQSMFETEGSGFNRLGDTGFLNKNVERINSFEFDAEKTRDSMYDQFEISEEKINVLSSEGLTGLWTNGNQDSKMFADRLHSMFPEAKILIVIREQESMLNSLYRHYIRRGGLRTPEEFLLPKKYLRCPDGSTPPGWERTPQFTLDYYKYHKLINHYQDLFSSENVLVLPMEILKRSEEEYINTIRKFAGVKDNVYIKNELFRKHEGITHFEAYIKRFTNPFLNSDSVNDYTWMSPLDVYKSQYIWEKLIYSINTITPNDIKEKIADERKNKIEEITDGYYCESNKKTNDLINTDLKQLGYDI